MDPALIAQLAKGALIPGTLALAALLVLWWKRKGPIDRARDFSEHGMVRPAAGDRLWATPLVFGGTYLITHAVLFEGFTLPPKSAFDWIAPLALAVTVLGALGQRVRFFPPARWALRATVLAIFAFLSASTLHAIKDNTLAKAMWAGAFALASCAAFWGAERTADRSRGPEAAVMLMVWAVAANQILALTYHSLRISQVAQVSAALCGAAMVVGIFRRPFSLGLGGAHVPVMLTAAAIFQGVLLATPPLYRFVYPALLTLSLVLAGVATFGKLGRVQGVKGALLRIGLMLLPLLAAGALAAKEKLSEETYEY